MLVQCYLKKWLAVERNIYRPSELQALLSAKARLQLSLQVVSTLIIVPLAPCRFASFKLFVTH